MHRLSCSLLLNVSLVSVAVSVLSRKSLASIKSFRANSLKSLQSAVSQTKNPTPNEIVQS